MRGGVKMQVSSVGNSLIYSTYFQESRNVLREKWGLRNGGGGFEHLSLPPAFVISSTEQ